MPNFFVTQINYNHISEYQFIVGQSFLLQWNTELRTTELRTKINSDQQSFGILRKVTYNNVCI